MDAAHERVAAVWKCKPSEVVFTSGGSESDNLAIFGAARRNRHKGRHLITSSIEHYAVWRCFEYLKNEEGFELTVLPVDSAGHIRFENLVEAIRPDTILVSILAANNETGILQPVADFGQLCRDRGVLFHTDASQYFGKEPVESIDLFKADLVTACSHKYHGPKGAGALYIRSGAKIEPIIHGGSQENEHRAGTENLAGIIGFTEATERFVKNPAFHRPYLEPMLRSLAQSIQSFKQVHLWSSLDKGLCNTLAFSVIGTDGLTLLANFDLQGLAVSSGSACTAGSLQPSRVLRAMGASESEANALIRISIGRENTEEEIQRAQGCFYGCFKQL